MTTYPIVSPRQARAIKFIFRASSRRFIKIRIFLEIQGPVDPTVLCTEIRNTKHEIRDKRFEFRISNFELPRRARGEGLTPIELIISN